MGRYAFSRSWGRENERLAALERQLDPVSQAAAGQLGLAAGWRCWEAGAGGGSMTVWLADRVTGSGSVLATDIDISSQDDLDAALAALDDQTRTVIGAPIVTAWGQPTG